MKDTLEIKCDDNGQGFYKNGSPVFYHKEGNCPIAFVEELNHYFPNGWTFIGHSEGDRNTMENDFG